MSEYRDESGDRSERGEKSDDKSRDDFKEINDKSESDKKIVEDDGKSELDDKLFEPKSDIALDFDDFKPDENYKSISMDFIPDKEYKPDMGSFEPKSDIALDFDDFKPDENYKEISMDFKPDKEYKPDMGSFEPRSDISRDIEDFKPDKNYNSDNNLPELNSEHKLNKDQEKDDKTLEPDREYEQDNNSLDEKSKLTDSHLESINDCESDIPIQSNENQTQAEIGEEKEQLQNKDKDNPLEKSNEELNAGDKEEFVENVGINHGINFEYLHQHDLKDIIEDIKSAEKDSLIYANDSLITVRELYSNEELLTEIKNETIQERDELNDNLERNKSENKNIVLIENLDDFRLSTGEVPGQEGGENRDRTQVKEFNRDSKKEFSRDKREDSKDKGVNSGNESGLSIARDSRQYTVQVLKSESQSLNQPVEHQDSSEKALLKEENQKSEQIKKEVKKDEESDQVTIEKRVLSSQEIRSSDKANKANEIEKRDIKKELSPIKDEIATPEKKVSKELDALKEIYRQESGKRPIYRGKETKGFIEWKREKTRLTKSSAKDSTNSLDTSDFKTRKNSEIQRIQSEKPLKKQESKERWESTLRNWMNEANEKDVSSETKKELTEIIEHYGELRENYKQLNQLIRKFKKRNLIKRESEQLISLIEKFRKVTPDHKKLFANLRSFRNFYLANEIWYKEKILAEKEKFTTFLAEKLQLLKKNLHALPDYTEFARKTSKSTHPLEMDRKEEKEFLDKIVLEDILIENFQELDHKKLPLIIKKYKYEIKSNANFGSKFTRKFLIWVSKNYNKDILKLIEKVNNDFEILKYLIYYIKNTKNSYNEIRSDLKNKGIVISEDKVREVARIILKDQYNERIEQSLIKSGVVIKYNDDFKYNLKTNITIIVSNLPLSENIKKKTIQRASDLFEIALNKGLTPEAMGASKNVAFMAIIVLFYSLISLRIKKIIEEKVSIRAIWRYLGNDYKTIGLSKTSYLNIRPSKFIPYLPKNVRKLVEIISHPHQLSYEEIKKFIESFSEELLTKKETFYDDIIKNVTSPSQTKIKIKCKEGHIRKTTYGNFYMGKRCIICRGLSPKTYKDIKELVESKGYVLKTNKTEFERRRLIENTRPVITRITVQCKMKHIWETNYDRLKANHECPDCIGTRPWAYENIKEFVESRGYVLKTDKTEFEQRRLRENTRPTVTRITVQCNAKHEWETNKDRLRVSGCPYCAQGMYERICRWYFNNILSYITRKKIKFVKVVLSKVIPLPNKVPEKFKNISFNKMHFDGYAVIIINEKKIILAFEYNGPQHYHFPNHIHKDPIEDRKKFEWQQLVDEYKRWLSVKNDIVLIEFAYYIDEQMRDPYIIQNYITKELENKINIKLNNLPQFNHSNQRFYKSFRF